MDKRINEYRRSEFDNLLKNADDEFKPQVQFNWTGSKTKWLSITENELRCLMYILTK